MRLQHILSVDQFTRPNLTDIFYRADVRRNDPDYIQSVTGRRSLDGKIAAVLFYEPSTRTFASFVAAIHRLGGSVIPIQNVQYSSVAKGETLEDTIRTLGCYADVIILRHPDVGAAARAAAVSSVPIINAGDGSGEHPTQALLDLYTIQREQFTIDGLTVTLMGDLKHGRTIHSLVKLLRLYRVNLNFVSPPSMTMPREYVAEGDFETHTLTHTSLDTSILSKTDVLYITRVQWERMAVERSSEPVMAQVEYRLMPSDLKDAKSSLTIMHPLPRLEEIDPTIDADPRAAYFRQVENGMFVRMALLEMVLKG